MYIGKSFSEILSELDNSDVRICVDTERTFISTLGMGCHTPVGCLAQIKNDDIEFSSFVFHEELGNIYKDTFKGTYDTIQAAAHETAERLRSIIAGKDAKE